MVPHLLRSWTSGIQETGPQLRQCRDVRHFQKNAMGHGMHQTVEIANLVQCHVSVPAVGFCSRCQGRIGCDILDVKELSDDGLDHCIGSGRFVNNHTTTISDSVLIISLPFSSNNCYPRDCTPSFSTIDYSCSSFFSKRSNLKMQLLFWSR